MLQAKQGLDPAGRSTVTVIHLIIITPFLEAGRKTAIDIAGVV